MHRLIHEYNGKRVSNRKYSSTDPRHDDPYHFDHKILEEQIKHIIHTKLDSENFILCDIISSPHCPTFVIAQKAVHMNGPPTLFRSYSGQGIGPSKCAIWEAARATSAAPNYFKEINIDTPPPDIRYIDGGLGYNNPSQLTRDESVRLWPYSQQICLVSLGSGRQKAVKIVGIAPANEDDTSVLYEHLRGSGLTLSHYFQVGRISLSRPACSR